MALGRDMLRLKRLPVFACFDEDALRLIAFSAETRRLPPGHVLFRRGEPAEAAVLLAGGTLALDEEREDSLSVRWVQAGTLLNETAMLASGMQKATAIAEEDAVVVAVSRALMLRVLDAYPDNVPGLRRYWAGRLQARLAAFKAEVRP